MRIFTIGYEGATMGEFCLGRLQKAGVERVIDVRAVANSGEPVFANALSMRWRSGIDYVHLRARHAGGGGAGRAGAGAVSPSRATEATTPLTNPDRISPRRIKLHSAGDEGWAAPTP